MKRKSVKSMIAVIIFTVLLLPFVSQADSDFGGETNIYLMGEYFVWKEFGDNNRRLVRENGPRFGIGASQNYEFFKHQLILKPRIEVLFGQVNFDGLTNTGVPVKSESNYFSGKIEADLGWRFQPLERISIEPFGGLGFRGWYRDIHGATATDGVTEMNGDNEEWYTAYGRAGLRGNLTLGDKIYFFAEGGGKFPFFARQIAHLDGPNATVRPKDRATWFAETGIRFKYIKASFYYENMKFGKSDVDAGTGYFQPKSQAEMFGIRLAVAF